MCLIFDKFPSKEKADAFAVTVKEEFGLEAEVFDSQEASEEGLNDPNTTGLRDWFPQRLDPPIVLTDLIDWDESLSRQDDIDRIVAAEGRVEKAVEPFGGTFAGT